MVQETGVQFSHKCFCITFFKDGEVVEPGQQTGPFKPSPESWIQHAHYNEVTYTSSYFEIGHPESVHSPVLRKTTHTRI